MSQNPYEPPREIGRNEMRAIQPRRSRWELLRLGGLWLFLGCMVAPVVLAALPLPRDATSEWVILLAFCAGSLTGLLAGVVGTIGLLVSNARIRR
jgi:hypothetical protein